MAIMSASARRQASSSKYQTRSTTSQERTVAAPSISSASYSNDHHQQQQRPASPASKQSFFSIEDAGRHRKQARVHLHPPDQEPSFSFVCLGVGGGPLEQDCSCYLMKPAHAQWQDGSIVVEGGSWLGALTTVLEQTGPDSAFHDFDFPSTTPTSFLRAGLIASFAESFLISHAHLDHILGLVLGSASLPGKRAVYGLKPTLENILEMFNGKIWPKLASWKEDEPYTMYHMRSLETQRPYPLNDNLSVLPFALSHGLNPSVPPAPPTPTYAPTPLPQSYFSKRNSMPLSSQMASFHLARGVDEQARALDRAIGESSSGGQLDVPSATRGSLGRAEKGVEKMTFNTPFQPTEEKDEVEYEDVSPGEPISLRASVRRTSVRGRGKARRPRTAQGSERSAPPPSAWVMNAESEAPVRPPRRASIDRHSPSLDSTAFFITHRGHDRDVLFFGDVEPDCVSTSPRNRGVWNHAAERFVAGKLSAVFLECSFPRNHPTQFLYGHLSVEHLFQELDVLANMVCQRRRHDPSDLTDQLAGLSIIIIHVKPALFPVFTEDETVLDPRSMPVKILDQLVEEESRRGLGVKFIMAQQGMRIEC